MRKLLCASLLAVALAGCAAPYGSEDDVQNCEDSGGEAIGPIANQYSCIVDGVVVAEWQVS